MLDRFDRRLLKRQPVPTSTPLRRQLPTAPCARALLEPRQEDLKLLVRFQRATPQAQHVSVHPFGFVGQGEGWVSSGYGFAPRVVAGTPCLEEAAIDQFKRMRSSSSALT